jgi:glycosyltransferase involved in cell wall biosynthesis
LHRPLAQRSVGAIGPAVLRNGRLPKSHAQKRPDLLVRAFARIADELPDSHLHIVGDGPGKTALEELAHRHKIFDRTVFHGYVPEREQGLLFKRAGCLVIPSPSLSEGLSLVVIDAIAHHVPVVLSDHGGGSFVVRDMGIGSLFKPNDEIALANAVCRTLRAHHRGEFDSFFGEATMRHFSASRMAEKYVELWRISLQDRIKIQAA